VQPLTAGYSSAVLAVNRAISLSRIQCKESQQDTAQSVSLRYRAGSLSRIFCSQSKLDTGKSFLARYSTVSFNRIQSSQF
jgi:hypothetical protein